MEFTLNGKLCKSLADVRRYASDKVADFVEEYFNDAEFVVAHTSGSTGTPKEIHLLKSDMQASAQISNEFFHLNEDSLFYLCLSPDYIAGKMMIVRAIEARAKLTEEPPSNTPLSRYAEGERIALLAVVPSQLGYLINNPEKLDMVDAMIIGGGKLPERIEYWLADKGVNAYKTYGMTETCSHVALSHVSRERLPYSAIGNVTFAKDERDCLVVNAPQFSKSQIVTNDVVALIDNRNFHWKGRYDNVINTGGLKIYPEEIEREIVKVLPHARIFVTSQPSDKWGDELVLALEYNSLPDGIKKEGNVRLDMVDKLRKFLPPHAIPRRYIAVKKFKMTDSGKIIREL